MRLIIFTVFVSFALANDVDKCAWGQSYWCSSLKVAKECGAINHCVDTVWKNDKSYEMDNEDVCQFCENFLTDAIHFLTNKTLTDEVRQYLDAACGIIPVSALADQCKDAVDNDLDEIIDMLKKLDPKAVCATIGLCSGFKDTVHHAEIKAEQDIHRVPLHKVSNPLHVVIGKPKLKGDVCADCKTLVGDIKSQITSKTEEDQIEKMLKTELCSQLGELQSECEDLVDMYVPEILQLLADQIDPTMTCGAMGFCPSNDPLLLVKMKLQKSPLYKAASTQVTGEAECSFCKIVIEELKDLESSKVTQQAVENFLKNEICAKLGSLKDECDQTVDQYGPFIFELLDNELDPETRCKSLGFCAASSTHMLSITRMATPIKQAPKPAPVKMAGKAGQSPECVLCEFVMTELDHMLEKNSTKLDIENAVDKICMLLPDTIKLECKNFIDFYGDAIIELLIQELSPDQICSSLGLCSKSSIQKVKDDQTCQVCKMVVTYVVNELGENKTVEEIEKILGDVCAYLPTSFQPECNSFVKQYGPMIAKLLLQELSPDEVCKEIGLCTASLKISKPVKDGESCTLCKMVVTYVDSLLSQNATVEEIEKLLDDVCSYLPASMQPECTSLVKQYGPMIAKLLLQELSPDEVCKEIGLCTASLKISKQVGDSEECTICEVVVQYLDSFLQENATVQEIEKWLDKICNFLPSSLKSQCDDFVAKYGPMLIQLLEGELTPQQVCQEIGLCDKEVKEEVIKPVKVPLVGDNECTYGPAFWCSTMENAKRCKAVDHCQKHVWRN